jgi:predicted dehydrogenase
MLDLERFLVGEVASVCGMPKTFQTERQMLEDPKRQGKVDVDDAFISMLRFENGAIGSVEASRFTAGRKNYATVEVHGTKGSLGFNMERLGEIEFYSSNDPAEIRGFERIVVGEQAHPYAENWWPVGHVLGWGYVFINEVHHLVDCVVNDKPVAPLGATFDDGAKNNEILEAIARSIEKNSWTSLPL